MAKNKRFNGVSAFIYAVMGFCLAANQSLVNNIAGTFGADAVQLGDMIGALYCGSLAAVLFVGEFAQRFGKRRAAALTAAAVCLGSLTVLLAGSVAGASAGFFLYGVGIGGFESCVMALVSDNNGENANRFSNFLQALFSTGAVAAPLLLAALLGSVHYKPFYLCACLWYAAMTVYFLADRRVDAFAVRGEAAERGFAFFGLVRDRTIRLYMLAMLIYLGSETAFTYWIGSYFTLAGCAGFGAAALSVYWLASIGGRLIGTAFRSPSGLMPPCFLLGAAGCALLLCVHGAVLKLIAVAVVGIAFGPLYAGLLLLAGTRFPERSAAAFSLMIFSAGVGGIAFQPLLSRLLASGAVNGAYLLIIGLCLACALILWLVHRGRSRSGA